MTDHVLGFGKTICDDCLYSLIDLIGELRRSDEMCASELRLLQFCMPASSYVSGFATPSLENVPSYGTVHIEMSAYRFSQRLVAKQGFVKQRK